MPPRTRTAAPGGGDGGGTSAAGPYALMAALTAFGAARVVTLAARFWCAAVAAAFALVTAAAVAGRPRSPRARVALAVGTRVALTAAHNLIVAANVGPQRPLKAVSWPIFFAGRTGPLITLFFNLAAPAPCLRGRPLAIMLGSQLAAAALTQAGTCATMNANYPAIAYYYNALADAWTGAARLAWTAVVGGADGGRVGGAGRRAPLAAAPPAAACNLHACRAVQGHLYALAALGAYLWARPDVRRRPPPGHRGGWDGGHPGAATRPDRVIAAVLGSAAAALAAWAAIAILLPRPPGCEAAAAAAAWPLVAALRGGQ